MDAAVQLKRDVREGRIDGDRLVDLLIASQRQLQAALQELEQAKKRIEELKKELGGSPTAKTDQPYSMRAEEQRQEARGKKRRKERFYALQDPNWNVTAISDATGTVQERYAYTGYGLPNYRNGSFGVISYSAYSWETLFAATAGTAKRGCIR